ncbi:MAG: hypothetical protein Q4B58_09085 [Bacteroidales bacterium]|nr:hypothetical protein [Bacteroidales bacterium]
MEKTVQILKQYPLQERQYTDRNGTPQVFASRGFEMTDGIDTFYAEAVGDFARSLMELDPSVYHRLQGQMTCREYKGSDGTIHHQNEVKIIKIS